MRKLEEAGYVRQIRGWMNGRVYAISLKGKRALAEAGMSGGTVYKRAWGRGIVGYYLRGNGAGLALAELFGVSVRSQYQLTSEVRSRGVWTRELTRRIPEVLIDRPVPMTLALRHFGDLELERKRWTSPHRRLWLYLITADSWRWDVLREVERLRASDVFVGNGHDFRQRLGETVFVSPRLQTTLRELIAQPASITEAY